MSSLNLLIKPASSNCNLECDYCFYHSISKERTIECYGMMDIQLLEKIVRMVFNYAWQSCSFCFQGGEPTLRGLDFFKRFIEFEKKYNTKGIKVAKSIQTNGLIIDDEWAKFLARHKFLVGLSLDGPEKVHNVYRKDSLMGGTFDQVMQTIELFDKYKVDYNILSVVTPELTQHVSETYNFFKRKGFKYLQFIPCITSVKDMEGNNPYSLTNDEYAKFLKNLFDEWYHDFKSGERISIRFFDNLVLMLLGYSPEACEMNGHCSIQYVIEANGGVYPCDFYTDDEWYLGNIEELNFTQLRDSVKGQQFLEASKDTNPKCQFCNWIYLCRGGCRRFREPMVEGKYSLNYFCSAYQDFFAYAGNRIVEIANLVVAQSSN